MILDSKKIPYNKLDVAADTNLREKMREIVGDPKALPPQLCNGNQYCGVSNGRERVWACIIMTHCLSFL